MREMEMTARELLAAWESALTRGPVDRGVALLAVAYPDCPPQQLWALTIGQRNRRLLEVRERWFGPRLGAVATCPRCAQPVELSLDVADLRSSAVPGGTGAEGADAGLVRVDAGGFRVTCRLPTSDDLAALEARADDGAALGLLRRCVTAIDPPHPPIERQDSFDAAALPAAVIEAVAERLSAADPQADMVLAIECPACAAAWPAAFDIAAYLFGEVHTWAQRLLREVHTLASAYGWSEADILALSPLRRQTYLDAVLGLA